MRSPTFSDICKFRSEAPYLKEMRVVGDLIGRRGQLAPLLRREVFTYSNRELLRVLDIGAYDRALGSTLRKLNVPCVYHSLDVDITREHDFRDFQEVVDRYHFICMFELIEHLSFEEVNRLFCDAYDRLLPGGKLFISTPNPFHLMRYFSDVSHKQHWPATDLFALLRHVGFEKDDVQMYGLVYHAKFSIANAGKWVLRWVRDWSWWMLGLPYKEGIFAVATRSKL